MMSLVTSLIKKIFGEKETSKDKGGKPRQIRSDIKVGNLEKKLGVAPGVFRNPNGRDMRSDKTLGTLRKEAKKSK